MVYLISWIYRYIYVCVEKKGFVEIISQIFRYKFRNRECIFIHVFFKFNNVINIIVTVEKFSMLQGLLRNP